MAEKAKDYDRGTRIADRRKELGLTQDELAYRVGIGRPALSSLQALKKIMEGIRNGEIK